MTEHVTFTSMSGWCELSAESKDNYWIIRFLPDGTRVNLRNMTVCAGFPNTSLTRKLDYAAIQTRQMIADYQAATDEVKRTALWRQIREALEEPRVNGGVY